MVPRAGWYLTIRDGATGEVYARYRVQAGDCFSTGVIHSVNLRPLVDLYVIGEDHLIYAEETIYYQFGAGVQTELNEGETFEIAPDGALIVSDIHKPFEQLYCSAGGVSDRTLMLGDIRPVYRQLEEYIGVYTDQVEREAEGIRVISLSGMCGKDTILRFTCEFRLL